MNASEESIFHQALDVPDPSARAELLAAACGSNDALRQRVESLLSAFGHGQFLESPPTNLAATVARAADAALQLGAMIGNYKLLEQIGEGGMGIVYLAQQTQPVKRRVALKLIKPGMDSRQVIARFEAERQALALMDHPNIARVLDAGTTGEKYEGGRTGRKDEGGRMKDEGDPCFIPHPSSLASARPYFVMELVLGLPITEYCDAKHLPTRERLLLICDVCRAVQHAHQKGVIHRDLKPSNVLVTVNDGAAVVKVIDFGVAKALDQPLTERTYLTHFSQLIGTPLYMSPEQAELTTQDVDTRSDVYSLGVLLYELLTGHTPFDRESLKDVSFDELRRIIREDEPPAPSSRLSTLNAEAASTLSQRRGLDQRRLTQLLRGELDWIVMKALEKDRNRRYESASSLAADIERYLCDEPVLAGPPSTVYRLRKFARRNRAVLTSAGLVAAALLLGTVVSLWQAIRAGIHENKALSAVAAAQAATAAEKTQRTRAEAKEREAQDATDEAYDVIQFLRDKVLAAGRPIGTDGGLGKGVSLRQAVDAAEPEIASAFGGRPLTEAAIRQAIGTTYLALGETAPAIAQFRRALELRKSAAGVRDFNTLVSMSDLAQAFLEAGDVDQALPLIREAHRLAERHPQPDKRAAAEILNNVACAEMRAGQWNVALTQLQEARRRQEALDGPDGQHVFVTINNIAAALQHLGRWEESQQILEEALPRQQAVIGPKHVNTLTTMHNLASVYSYLSREVQAIEMFETTLKAFDEQLGPDHFDTLKVKLGLAGALVAARGTKHLPRARGLYLEVLEHYQDLHGPDHAESLSVRLAVSKIKLRLGQIAEALPELEEIYRLQQVDPGPDDPETIGTLTALANAHRAAGHLPESADSHAEALRRRRVTYGNDHPETQENIGVLAFAWQRLGRHDLALPLFKESHERAPGWVGADSIWLDVGLSNLADAYLHVGEFAEAERCQRQRLEKLLAQPLPLSPDTDQARSALAYCLLRQGKQLDEAERLLRDAVAAEQSRQSKSLWFFDMQSRLGGVLLAQASQRKSADATAAAAKLGEAETLLVAAHSGLASHRSKLTGLLAARWSEVLERLRDLYKLKDQPQEAEKWQRELDGQATAQASAGTAALP